MSLNRGLSLNKMSLNRECTVFGFSRSNGLIIRAKKQSIQVFLNLKTPFTKSEKKILTSCKILRNFCKYDLIEITSWISTKLLASLLLLLPQLLHMVDPTPPLLSFCKNKNKTKMIKVHIYFLWTIDFSMLDCCGISSSDTQILLTFLIKV